MKYLDRLPQEWFTLDVMREKPRQQNWVALVVDVHLVREAWVRIPGKHRSRDAAWDAFQDMIETRH